MGKYEISEVGGNHAMTVTGADKAIEWARKIMALQMRGERLVRRIVVREVASGDYIFSDPRKWLL